MKAASTIATVALLAVLALLFSSSAVAASPALSYGRALDEIDLHLRFGIELGPAELEGDVAFTANLCLAAQTAEAAAETPAANVDWHGLEYVVNRHDLTLTKEIEATLHGADRRVEALGRRFAGPLHGSPTQARVLRRGVAEVRGGILRLLVGLDGYRGGFHHFLRHDCAGAESAIAAGARPIRRGLVRIESGMGLLTLLAEPVGPRA